MSKLGLLVDFFNLFRNIPSNKTTALLKQGGAALRKSNFKEAYEIYEKIPAHEKKSKFVRGFFLGIDSEKKKQEFFKSVVKKYNKTQP